MNGLVPEEDAPRGMPLAGRHASTLIRRARQNGCNLTLPPCFQLWDRVVSGEWVLAVDQWLCVPEREIESVYGSVSQASHSSCAREAHVHPLQPHLFFGMSSAGASHGSGVSRVTVSPLNLFYCRSRCLFQVFCLSAQMHTAGH